MSDRLEDPSAPEVGGSPDAEDLLATTIAQGLSGTTFTTSVQHRWLVTTFVTSGEPSTQGWKLHVSAHPATATDVLVRVLPVLGRHAVRFKVASSPRGLMILNSGAAGQSQIGKFITVYPKSDEQAVALAAELHSCTKGLSGPSVPSDRAYQPGSLVHYRFGSFTGSNLMQLPDGSLISGLTSPAGDLEPDQRLSYYAPPQWAVCPFPESVATTPDVPLRDALRESSNYRVVGLLSDTGRGPVFIGVDLGRRRRCVFKTAARGSDDGQADAASTLRREASVLQSLPNNPGWPEVFDVLETPDQLVLVMEDIEGATLGEHVSNRDMLGQTIDTPHVVKLGQRLTRVVAALHGAGVVHRDLKSSNVLVTPDEQIRLIDFEHAARAGEPGRPGGTRGYTSPQQIEGRPATFEDDVYAVGALLLLMATGCEPSQAPNAENLLTRPPELLRPSIAPELAAVIRACLTPSAADRPHSMATVTAALGEIQQRASVVEPTDQPVEERAVNRAARPELRTYLLETATQLCDGLCARALAGPGDSLTWISTTPGTLPVPYRQINNGVPGVLLGLAAGVKAFGIERHHEVLLRGARWLAESPERPGAKISGLYAGEAGVGAALLVGGLTIKDPALIQAAHECELRLRDFPFDAVDLYHGTAGRLRFLVMLWLLDHDPDVLAHAVRCADHLHAKAVNLDDAQTCWKGDAQGGELALASYAHGTSGIADALLDLYDATDDRSHLDLAQRSARWVASQAVPCLPDHSGLDWGNGGTFGGLWCYGASGVGLLFLRLHHLGHHEGALEIAKRAGRSAALAGRYASPGLCHGLGGSIEYLLDLHHQTGEPQWIDQAGELQRLLDAFRQPRTVGVGYPTTPEDDSDTSYMLGDAGIIGTLLRLATDVHTPRLLSTDAIRSLGDQGLRQ